MIRCESRKLGERIDEVCENGHLNNQQCYNFLSHAELIIKGWSEQDWESMFLTEAEMNYLRKMKNG